MKTARVAILLVAILWGSSFAFQKGLLESINPVVFTFYNFLITGLLFLGYALYKKQNIFYRLREGVILGVLITSMEITQMFGLDMSTAANTSFISNLGMLIIPYIGWIAFGHRVKSFDSYMLLLALLGMYFLVGGVDRFNTGDLFLCISAIFMSLYFIFSERFEGEKGSHMATLCAQQFILVGVLSLVGAYSAGIPLSIPGEVVFDFGWQILLFTALPYTLIQWASKYSDEMMLALYDGVVEPLVGGLVAWGLFQEPTALMNILGGLVMVLAFGTSVIYTKKHPLLRQKTHVR